MVQAQQLASTIALVFIHLRYVDHHEAAIALAPALVGYGALAAIAGALLTLAQRDLRGFYRGTTAAHGGMLLAALGTASIGNFAAALLVAVTIGLALGGLGMMITSLEERVGPVAFSGPGGRAGAFPTLAAVFALFGFAGFALPGTAGFVADDLLLHTLWTASPTSAVAVILTSALIAVATLIAYSRVFLGATVPSHAPDLYLRERLVAVGLFALLVLLGIAPGSAAGTGRRLSEFGACAALMASVDLKVDGYRVRRSRLASPRVVVAGSPPPNEKRPRDQVIPGPLRFVVVVRGAFSRPFHLRQGYGGTSRGTAPTVRR